MIGYIIMHSTSEARSSIAQAVADQAGRISFSVPRFSDSVRTYAYVIGTVPSGHCLHARKRYVHAAYQTSPGYRIPYSIGGGSLKPTFICTHGENSLPALDVCLWDPGSSTRRCSSTTSPVSVTNPAIATFRSIGDDIIVMLCFWFRCRRNRGKSSLQLKK